MKSIIKPVKYLSLALYGFVALGTAALLFINQSVDVGPLILPVIIALYISALGFSYAIASKNQNNKAIVFFGTILLAAMFAGLAFFAIAGVAWFIGIAQDEVRRGMLYTRNQEVAMDLMYQMAMYGNRIGTDVIVEGILWI